MIFSMRANVSMALDIFRWRRILDFKKANTLAIPVGADRIVLNLTRVSIESRVNKSCKLWVAAQFMLLQCLKRP